MYVPPRSKATAAPARAVPDAVVKEVIRRVEDRLKKRNAAPTAEELELRAVRANADAQIRRGKLEAEYRRVNGAVEARRIAGTLGDSSNDKKLLADLGELRIRIDRLNNKR